MSAALSVAGVAGSGKTTVGALLAGQLGWRFADADTFHPASNVEKMRAGIPLTDADRKPWLLAVTGWIDENIATLEQRLPARRVATLAWERADAPEWNGSDAVARLFDAR